MLVRSAATFAEMLEAELNCTNVPPASSAWNRPLTAPLFIFDLSRPVGSVSGIDLRSAGRPLDSQRGPVAHAHPRVPHQQRTAPRSEPPATQTIRLTAPERRALEALNNLGADLGDSLSPRTLRRAFRRLARRYHPDRHPGSSTAEHERLARVFVEATEHYRVLVAALAAHVRSG